MGGERVTNEHSKQQSHEFLWVVMTWGLPEGHPPSRGKTPMGWRDELCEKYL